VPHSSWSKKERGQKNLFSSPFSANLANLCEEEEEKKENLSHAENKVFCVSLVLFPRYAPPSVLGSRWWSCGDREKKRKKDTSQV